MTTQFDPELKPYNKELNGLGKNSLNGVSQNGLTNYSNTQLHLEPISGNGGSNAAKPQRRSAPLRAQLLMTILPAVLLPLGLAGLVSYGIVSQRAQQQTEQLLQNEALLASNVFYELLQESQKIPATVASNPLVINAARATTNAAQAKSLQKVPIDQLEKSFSATKLLQPNPVLNDYLSRTAKISKFAEIFFTDKLGFNTAYSNPTSDFVQSDEEWWQKAKTGTNGQFIEPKFDESSKTFGVELNQVITDPASGEFLGVVKGVLPGTAFSSLFSNTLGNLSSGRSQTVQILALKEDGTIAIVNSIGAEETGDNQKVRGGEAVRERAKTLIETIQTQKGESGQGVTTALPKGVKSEWITSKSGEQLLSAKFNERGRSYVLTTVPKTNWIIAASIELSELKATGGQTALTFSLIFLLLGGIIAAAVVFLARRLATPLRQLATTAEQVVAGDLNVQAKLAGPTETQTLAQAFNNLVTQVRGLLHEQQIEAEQARLFGDIAVSRARTDQDLEDVFNRTVKGALQTLKADRVVIYRFTPDWRGYICAEAVVPVWPRALGSKIEDSCIGEHLLEAYRNGRVVPTNNVFEAGFHPDHIRLMERLEIKANLVTPILKDGQLFGLLIAHHCSAPHIWQQFEIDFLQELAIRVGLSLDRVSFLAQKEAEAERAQQLNEIISRVRESVTAEEIHQAAITGVCETLKTDRAVVYLFDENWQGSIVAESVGASWPKALGANITDPCFAERYVEKYKRGRVKAVENIYAAGLTECYLGQLEPFKVKANLVAPILAYNKLHGLLVTHQCSSTRAWQESEINFFKQVATQVGLALDRMGYLAEIEQSRQKAESLAQEQRQQKEALQLQLLELLSDVEGAAQGDLTVRADVTAGEIGTVADFFNSVVESLRGIVTNVKKAATQLNVSLGDNEGAIRQLSLEALKQAEVTTMTLDSVQSMTRSIQEVAENARQAAVVARTASSTAEAGGIAMDRTVENIFTLRETVAETAKKVKRLGESSQRISKVASLIEQIALQTNLLAINAGIEAARAGEQGQGFAVVAEEVGELAARSTAATKEIEQIVESIQQETAEVVEAMELGTVQVVEGTHLVQNTKQSLSEILDVSRQIDVLVQSISNATVSQAGTSQVLTDLMEEIALVSERTSDSTRQVSGSLQETVGIAQELQASVSTFKVDTQS